MKTFFRVIIVSMAFIGLMPVNAQDAEVELWQGVRSGMNPAQVAIAINAMNGVEKAKAKKRHGIDYVDIGYNKDGLSLFGITINLDPVFTNAILSSFKFRTTTFCSDKVSKVTDLFETAFLKNYEQVSPEIGAELRFVKQGVTVSLFEDFFDRPKLVDVAPPTQAERQSPVGYALRKMQIELSNLKSNSMFARCPATNGRTALLRVVYESTARYDLRMVQAQAETIKKFNAAKAAEDALRKQVLADAEKL